MSGELRTITFEVDTVEMFDAIRAVGNDFSPVGDRLASCLLSGSNWRDAAGLSFYGIRITDESVTPVTPTGNPSSGTTAPHNNPGLGVAGGKVQS